RGGPRGARRDRVVGPQIRRPTAAARPRADPPRPRRRSVRGAARGRRTVPERSCAAPRARRLVRAPRAVRYGAGVGPHAADDLARRGAGDRRGAAPPRRRAAAARADRRAASPRGRPRRRAGARLRGARPSRGRGEAVRPRDGARRRSGPRRGRSAASGRGPSRGVDHECARGRSCRARASASGDRVRGRGHGAGGRARALVARARRRHAERPLSRRLCVLRTRAARAGDLVGARPRRDVGASAGAFAARRDGPRARVFGVALTPVAWLVFQASVAAAPPPCGGELYGRVVDRTTAEPVAEARVVLEASPEAPRVVLTDEAGEFRFAEVCPGPWKIALERADYESETRRGTLGHGAGQVQVDVAIEPRLTHRLEDIVVEAPAPAEAGAGLNTALGDEALERLRGRSFTDALARLPGVSVLRSSAGGLGQPILRGQFGRRNLVIYDGVRHEGQRWGIEHAPEIDPWAVGRMSGERGARAIRYGPEAVGGVVLVEPPAMPTEPGITGQADLVGVSNGRRSTAALRVDGAHARVPGLAWRVDGNVTRGAALMAPDYP